MKELSVIDYLPEGWSAPRYEFFVQGFGDTLAPFRFDAAPRYLTLPTTMNNAEPMRVVPGAKCFACGSVMQPDRPTLVDHARLHLAVKLAQEAILAAKSDRRRARYDG